ncbi:MAG: hypothetical protein HY800_08465 [Ignavibacteriales bacterium]|nr:hypothetical protein [Ignavibacteriales bacterium]
MLKNIFRICVIIIVMLFVGLGVSYGQKKTTVHGEIIEVTSFVKEGLKPTSPSKKELTMDNLKKGGMLGIVDRANKLYLLVPSVTDTAFMKTVTPYLGVKSFVKGQLYMRSGVRIIVLEDIGKSLK